MSTYQSSVERELRELIDELERGRNVYDGVVNAKAIALRLKDLLAAAPAEVEKRGSEVQVAGRMEQTFAEHTRRLGILIREEQEKPLPNNVLIAALCDSVRLAREAI